MASNLFGRFHVTPTPSALSDARNLFKQFRHYQEVRRHALKLAFWPSGEMESGQVCDLDWESIVAMPKPRACELRIDDVIGGFNNLRLIFYIFEDRQLVLPGDALPRLWVLSVLQKKTERFSRNALDVFSARVTIIRKRLYHAHL